MDNSSDENSLVSRYSLITHIPLSDESKPAQLAAPLSILFVTTLTNSFFLIFSIYFSGIALTTNEMVPAIHFIFLSLSILRVLFFMIRLLFSLTKSDYSNYILFHIYFGDLFLAGCSFAIALEINGQKEILGRLFYVFVWIIGWYITTFVFVLNFLLVYLYILESRRNYITKIYRAKKYELKVNINKRKICVKCNEEINFEGNNKNEGRYFIEFNCGHFIHICCMKNKARCDQCTKCGGLGTNVIIEKLVKLIFVIVEFL